MNMLLPLSPAPQDPDRVAYRIAETGEEVTFGQLETRTNQAAHLFRTCGLTRGDHIVLLAENCRQYFEICFAADRAGLYYTAISTHATAEDAAFIVENCGAKLWILSQAKAEIARHLCDVSPIEYRYMIGAPVAGCDSWDDATALHPETRIADESQGLDMLYSSGTTGRPKGVKWEQAEEPAGNRTMLVELLGDLFTYTSDTRYLSPAPLYHAAPLRHTMTVIKLGGCVTVMQKFSEDRALQLIEAEKITHSQWVPTMFIRMLKLPEETRLKYDCSSLKVAIHAAAPCPVVTKEAMIDLVGFRFCTNITRVPKTTGFAR